MTSHQGCDSRIEPVRNRGLTRLTAMNVLQNVLRLTSSISQWARQTSLIAIFLHFRRISIQSEMVLKKAILNYEKIVLAKYGPYYFAYHKRSSISQHLSATKSPLSITVIPRHT
ncbi:hypothetical protein KIN20_024758 [Parelaphostrongylus tenuis]|uniref:Uncharacterized protein n=1 Tax=Parelaphostrongylus tenuis TaxID=148309 RepID=A0AAD5QWH1_PARTN|nr:hypothetical protein KIN20_024758 [Parelaphostrongylus tenuis]